jgi:hypothetical protein
MKILIVVALLAVGVAIWLGPSDGQMNYKTGTVRYRKCYIPFSYKRLYKFEAEWTSLGLEDKWGVVVRYPLKSSNNTDGMVRRFAMGIAIWSKYDVGIAKIMADDLVGYINRTEGETGLPEYSIFYSPFAVDFASGTLKNSMKEWDYLDDGGINTRIIQVIKNRG